MRYGEVPHLNKKVSRFILGSVPFSLKERERTFALIDAFRAAGGNTIDLSFAYAGGNCSAALGEYMAEKGCRDELVLFNKGGHHHGETRRVTHDAIFADQLESLKVLKTEQTEFMAFHRDNILLPIGRIVEWFNEMKNKGFVEVFGGSNFHHSRVREANKYAAEKGLQGFSVSSSNISLATVNEAMWDECVWLDRVARDWYEETQFPMFSWSSGGGGYFADIDNADIRRVYGNKYNVAKRERVHEFSKKTGASPTAIALAWILNQPMNIFPIIGPYNVEQLKDNLTALEVELDPDMLRYLELGS